MKFTTSLVGIPAALTVFPSTVQATAAAAL
jgi:hypothetical protein